MKSGFNNNNNIRNEDESCRSTGEQVAGVQTSPPSVSLVTLLNVFFVPSSGS